MSRRLVLGIFGDELGLLTATREVRRARLSVVDVFSPYPVHGLDKAMGLLPSKLPWLCFGAAVVGAVVKLWFEFWTMSVSWPVNVGGKPWNSLPAYAPVTFEVMVLAAGLSTVLAFLIWAKLRPGKKPVLWHSRVTDDRFVLIVEQADARYDAAFVGRLLQRCGALEVEERLVEV